MKDWKDPDQAELEKRMCDDINKMPEEVQPRFKALQVLYNQIDQFSEEEQIAQRQLELKYEKLYQEVYRKRAALLAGDKEAVDQALLDKFDQRSEILKEFGDVEIEHVEVREIQNVPFGVPSFWQKAMCANKSLAPEVYEKDRPILAYLQDIVLDQHEDDYGFDLTFKFEKNAYFNQTELKKSFAMKQPNSCEKAVGTEIQWKDASCDVTKTKKKKGKGKKKTTVTVKCDSFFNFFTTTEEVEVDDKDDDADEDEAQDDPNEQL